ncbi:tRNA lysidine(34) synthetase [Anaerolactibacter massiliensis]|uniref:tRNA lysidine(34) synthetase n=1 Tax=Anaerolactibacter massiliensis TaxID=2044573 RepID=UPI000CFA24D6|nr:ATP-binding protein [Anaerolactibacter massiliensis]
MAKELTRVEQIERSIIKTYKTDLWAPFLTSINRYELIQPNDRIAVCISGGKDSFCMAKMFQILSKHTEIPFETEFLVMDPGYSEANRKKIEENAEILGIPIRIFETNIFAVADHESKSPCYLCARMRRGHLYNQAKLLGCNKIALGHHLNDVIETTVMAMFYSSKLETIIPKAHSENFPGMELIRPMYCVKENAVIRWAVSNQLEFLQCACRFTENNANLHESTSKRKEVKELIRQLKKTNPEIEDNIFRSLHRVQIETFPGYKADGAMHSFLENYESRNRFPGYGKKDS